MATTRRDPGPELMRTRLRDAALTYAAEGIPVFPLSPGTKVPAIPSGADGKKHGFHDATTDPNQIREWWERYPGANIGMPTGEASGLDVIDEDSDEGGDVTPLQLPPTRMTRTPSGGRHLFFLHPSGVELRKDNNGKLGAHVDWQGDGAYVVLPPSVTADGDRHGYEWIDESQPLAPLPVQIVARILASREELPSVRQPRERATRVAPDDDGNYWLGKALDKARAGDARNDTGTWLACQLRDAGLTQTEAEPYMLDYADRVPAGNHPYTAREALATLRSVYTREAREPAQSHTSLNGHAARRRERMVSKLASDEQDPSAAGGEDTSEGEKDRDTQQDVLLRIADQASLFRTPTGSLHARVQVNGHHETWGITERGGGFRHWLVYQFGQMYNRAPSATALTQAMELVKSRAMFEGEVHEIHTRLASHEGRLYLDLANDAWQCVEISTAGWRIIDQAPVYFRRAASMLPLPTPQRGGSLEELRQFINVGSDDDWRLVVAWLVGVMHPTGPYPVLALYGERGSAKSNATRKLRAVIDPAKPDTRGVPKELDDLDIAAQNTWLLALDNLSHMPDALSDFICRLATGAGNAKRALYTDDGEAIFESKRPVIFNGIEEIATRGDLLDRMIKVTLPAITSGRRTEVDVNTAFTETHPRILGALLDVVVCALRNMPSVQLENLPRMADFMTWVTAAEPALSWPSGTIMRIYGANREEAINTELEAHPVARAVLALMETRSRWEGTAGELHAHLIAHIPGVADNPHWPKQPNKLTGALTRVAPALRAKGIVVDKGPHTRTGRRIVITIGGSNLPPTPPTGDDQPPHLSSPDRQTEAFDRHISPLYRHASSHPSLETMRKCDDSDVCDDNFSLFSVAEQRQEEKGKRDVESQVEQSSSSSQASPSSENDARTLRRALRAWAEAHGWPQRDFRRGAAHVPEGKERWEKVLQCAPLADLQAIWGAINEAEAS